MSLVSCARGRLSSCRRTLCRRVHSRLLRAGMACLLLCLLSPGSASASGGRIPWGSSLGAALKEARRTNRTVLVDFYADWCEWCKVLDAKTFPDNHVVAAARAMVPVRLNADTNGQAAARRYSVTGLPTILFLTPDGYPLDRIAGYMPPAQFADRIQQAQTLASRIAGWQSRLRANPGDGATALKLEHIYCYEGNAVAAAAVMNRLRRLDPNGRKGLLEPAELDVATLYWSARDVPRAQSLYQHTLRLPASATDHAKARMMLADCDAARRNYPAAVSELNYVLGTKGLPASLQSAARAGISRLQSMELQGH